MAKVMWMDWWTPVHVGDADDTTGLYESRTDLPDEELENVADMLTGNLRFLKRYGDEVSVTVDGIDLWADEQSVAHVAIEALCMDEPAMIPIRLVLCQPSFLAVTKQ